jgi:hypothetical protein
VHLSDKRPLDVAEAVAEVRARARPWRSIIAAVAASAAAIVSGLAGTSNWHGWSFHGPVAGQLTVVLGAAAFCLLAAVATVGFSRKARDVLEARTGTAHAAVVRYAIVLAGSLTIVIITLELLKVPIGNLVLGGAFTAVLIGIAAQQTLGNLFAGIMLLLARPFTVGEQVRMRAGALGGQIEGVVTDIGITYVRLDTQEGVLSVPNSQVLAAAVGPLRDPAEPLPAGTAQPGTAQPGTAQPNAAQPGSAAAGLTAAAAAAAAAGPGTQAGQDGPGTAVAPPPEGAGPQHPGAAVTPDEPGNREGPQRGTQL